MGSDSDSSKETKPVVSSQNTSNQVLPAEMSRGTLVKTHAVLFPEDSELTTDDFEFMYNRDELGHIIIDKPADDIFNKWFKIESEVKGLVDKFETFNKDKLVKTNFKQAYKMQQVHGKSLLFMGFNDASENIEEIPVSVKELTYIHPISKPHINDTIYDEEPTSPNYGKPMFHLIPVTISDKKQEVKKIPAGRFITFKHDGVGMDPEGHSKFEALYNVLLSKRTMDYATNEALWRAAGALMVLYYPKNATPEEITKAEEHIHNITVKSELSLPEGFKLVSVNLDTSSKNVEPTIEYVLNRIGSGSRMGKTTLVGTQAGAVTGSEFNFKEYYSFIADQQTEEIEPKLREFYGLMQEHGLLPQGDYTIIWNPRQEVEPLETAEINEKNANSADKMATAFVNFKTAGDVTIQENGKVYLVVDDSGKGVEIPGIETAEVDFTPPPPEAIAPEPTLNPFGFMSTNQTRLTDEEHLKIEQEADMDFDQLKPAFTAQLSSAISVYQETWQDEFELAWDTSDMESNYYHKDNQESRNGVDELMVKAQAIDPESDDIQKVIEDFMRDGYELGWEETADFLGTDIPFPINDEAVDIWIRNTAPLLKDDITLDVNQRYLREIRDGIAAGEGYKEINSRLRGITQKYSEGIPRTVHKIVHEAMNRARIDQYKGEGVKQLLFLTVGDDRVRPEHSQLETASPHPIDATYLYSALAEYGCRCTTTPYTVVQQLRDTGELF